MLRRLSLRQTSLFNFGKKKKKDRPRRKRVQRIKHIRELNVYDPITAFRLLKLHSTVPHNETIDLYFRLGIDTNRSEFNVRGSCYMPNGFGKDIRLCFLPANNDEELIAREAGINMICDSKMLGDIGNNKIKFDKLYATELGVAKLKPYARILGPKGLFPNKKVPIFYFFFDYFIAYSMFFWISFRDLLCLNRID